MAGKKRTASSAVEMARALEDEPHRYGFFQALRLLECAHPDRPRLGESTRPTEDAVRLAQEPSLAFAPATLASFQAGQKGLPPRLSVLFFGLFGPNGPLPLHLTEYARDRLRNEKDPTFSRFADIFHHRMLSLFYRAWAVAQPTVNFDRPQSDRFHLYLGALFGIGMPSLRDRDAAPDQAKLSHAGHLGCQTRHPDGLRSLLASYFQVAVDIQEFIGRWVDLPESSYCLLGESPQTGSLGQTVVVGARVWDRQGKFRVVLGPMSKVDYDRLLPGSPSLGRLVALIRSYSGDELMWDVKLVLKKEQVPPLVLGGPERLGWTTWLAQEPLEEDAGDLLLDPMSDPNTFAGMTPS